jgi:hypothetical protein
MRLSSPNNSSWEVSLSSNINGICELGSQGSCGTVTSQSLSMGQAHGLAAKPLKNPTDFDSVTRPSRFYVSS